MRDLVSKLAYPLSNDTNQTRRGFFKRCSAAASVLLCWRVANAETLPSAPTQLNLRGSSRYYPIPSYLPEGYLHAGIYLDRPDGFGGGPTEVALWYKNPTHPQGFANPLGIYMTPSPEREFGMTEKHEAKVVELKMLSGETIGAQYHDGIWMMESDTQQTPSGGSLQWKTNNSHSLVFQLRGLKIGIRGSRMVGINYDSLIRVAASLK